MTEPIDFDPAELFFSTTDSRGVIQKANSIFVRLSGYDWNELVGAPHNIIRHDRMPGGAFKLMWATLQAGEPFCAYVINQASSGRPYTVFATVTPLGDGYLSVRSRPCVDALRDTAFALYEDTRRVERELSAQGQSGPAVATAGLEHLAGLVAQAGLSSYTEFIEAALPAEVEARSKLVDGIESRTGEGPLYDLLRLDHSIEDDLTAWTAQMVDLAELISSLKSTADDLRAVAEDSSRTAAQVAEITSATSPIMLAINVWVSMVPEIQAQLTKLQGFFTELSESCAAIRFRIALARLHNDAGGAFATELIDARSGDTRAEQASGAEAILDLYDALHDGIVDTEERSRRNNDLAQQVAHEIEAVAALMQIPQGLLGNWQTMVAERTDARLTALVPTMAQQLDEGERITSRLSQLADECRQKVTPLDAAPIEEKLARGRHLLADSGYGAPAARRWQP